MNIRKILIKYIIIPIQNGGPIFWKNYIAMNRSQWLSSNEIRNIQWKKLQKLLNHAYLNIPYYHKLFTTKKITTSNINSFEDFSKIPCLTKQIIRENIDEMLNPKVKIANLIKQTTSGSTGEPVIIFSDNYAQNVHTVTGWRFREWAGHKIGDKYAQIWGGAAFNKKKNTIISFIKLKIRKILDNLFDPIERLNANDTISDSAMEDFYLRIKKNKIQHLVGYTSSIFFFAQFVKEHHNGEIKFSSVRTIAEMLHDYQRDLIENIFNCKVFDTYGNRENGLIAAECSSHNGYHVSSENLFIEILDETGNPVPLGDNGEIAITDLNNYSMPLIRYLTGDIGKFSSKSCSCGRGLVLIEKIEGRKIDTIILSDGSLLSGHVFTRLLRIYSDEIEKYQFIQRKKGEADLLLKLSRSSNNEKFQMFQNNLSDFLNKRLEINYIIVNEIPLHKSGKHKYIISEIP